MHKQLPVFTCAERTSATFYHFWFQIYIFAVKQNFTHIERNLYCQIFYITCRLIFLIQISSVSSYLSCFNS